MNLRVSVVGTGYLGATHAACMAELGHEVLGVDVKPARVEALAAGRLPFFEPGVPELLRRHTGTGRLRFTTSPAEAADFADVHFICVGTPQRRDSMAADTGHVTAAVEGLVPHLTRSATLVGKSTVPVGTGAELAERIAAVAAPGVDVELAWNPEFLREGHAVDDTLRPDRLVFGVPTAESEKVLRQVYQPLLDDGVPLVVTDVVTAELVKVSANAFLATKISFINAIAELCEVAGADVVTLAEAIGHDPRIGHRALGAGLGFGGGCLPKDIRAFMARAGELGVDQALTFLREVDAINMRRRSRMVQLAEAECSGSVLGKRIAVLGAAFKPMTDDVRDSPALNVAAQLQLRGAQVCVYDPQAVTTARAVFPTLSYAESAAGAAAGAHLVLHLTEWAEFAAIDPGELAAYVAERRILDGRNTLDPERWRAAGWSYRALGRPRLS
ncbi:MAG: UDP-glucose/GDP-mannose dehydrogenase family protein [Actinomycetota bacterium]|nr:UDP-glucose/GDP-mannose dehydrogenase family protein [Actinomycetota bacterium]